MNMGTVKAYDASITTTSSAKRSPWLGDIIEHARTLYVLKYIGKTKGPRRRHVTSCPLASGPPKWIFSNGLVRSFQMDVWQLRMTLCLRAMPGVVIL